MNDQISYEINEWLLKKWDPIGVGMVPEAEDEYNHKRAIGRISDLVDPDFESKLKDLEKVLKEEIRIVEAYRLVL